MSSGPNFFLFEPDRLGVGRDILGSGVYWILKVWDSTISGNCSNSLNRLPPYPYSSDSII